MAERILIADTWHERHDWREDIDLATAERHELYAAGREDGYRQAVTEFHAMWSLLVDVDEAWTDEDIRQPLEARAAQLAPRLGKAYRHLQVVR